MQLTRYLKIKLLLCSFIPLYLNSSNLESILSEDRLKQFELDKKKVIEDSSKLRKDWINPITYSYSKIDGEINNYEKSVIRVDQPIFKSGGIYKAIKYANASEEYSNLTISIEKKSLITQALTLLYNIHKIDLEVEKTTYILKNAQIDVQRKKEQVLNGFLDTSYLDNAILDANSAKKNLINLKYQKKELINKFNNIASGEYDKFNLPTFQLISKKEFINRNLELLQIKATTNTKYEFKGMVLSKYLPTLNATYDYTRNHSSTAIVDKEIQNVGISISMPFDIRTFNDIESTQIDYLKSKLQLKNKTLEEENFYKSKLTKIKTIEEKIDITKEDYKLYTSLLDTIMEEKNAGLKTTSDVETLSNSSKVKELELKIFKLDKQIELLEIYSKLN